MIGNQRKAAVRIGKGFNVGKNLRGVGWGVGEEEESIEDQKQKIKTTEQQTYSRLKHRKNKTRTEKLARVAHSVGPSKLCSAHSVG
jgi:hypothetical protein